MNNSDWRTHPEWALTADVARSGTAEEVEAALRKDYQEIDDLLASTRKIRDLNRAGIELHERLMLVNDRIVTGFEMDDNLFHQSTMNLLKKIFRIDTNPEVPNDQM